MKVLVPIKRVIDYNVKVRVNADNTNVDLSNTKMAINPFCEIAVEEAVRLKEAGIATEVVIVSIGDKACQEQLRNALALGGDRAIHIETDTNTKITGENIEALNIAKLLQKIVIEEQPQLVILGKQSIDSDNSQTGQMLAALTGMPQGTFASEISVNTDKVNVTREVDGGLQTLTLNLPAVITADLRLNVPRYASLPNIMKAKRKPLTVRPASEFNIDLTPRTTLLKVTTPAPRKAGIVVASIDELIDKLKNEAKVIS